MTLLVIQSIYVAAAMLVLIIMVIAVFSDDSWLSLSQVIAAMSLVVVTLGAVPAMGIITPSSLAKRVMEKGCYRVSAEATRSYFLEIRCPDSNISIFEDRSARHDRVYQAVWTNPETGEVSKLELPRHCDLLWITKSVIALDVAAEKERKKPRVNKPIEAYGVA